MNVRKLAPPARVGQSAMRTVQFVDILWINLTAQSAAILVLGGESTKNILFFFNELSHHHYHQACGWVGNGWRVNCKFVC